MPVQTPDISANLRAVFGERLASGTLKLPMLPKVAGQVMAITSDPKADLADLSDLIHRDQALASHVLRVANSVAYATAVPIVSLQQAVTRLGMTLLAEIATALSVQGETFSVPAFHREVRHLWRHALASGTYGKEVARLKRRNVEGQFLCGLLHTVGKPVAWQLIADWQQEHKTQVPTDLACALVEEFHCPIGQALAEKWQLPKQVQISSVFYQRYAEVTSFREETAMTYLSDRLATFLTEAGTIEEGALAQDPVLAALNIYPDEFSVLLARRARVLEIVQGMDI